MNREVNKIRTTTRTIVKAALILSVLCSWSDGVSAARRKPSPVSRFSGSPETQSKAFNRFIVQNVGRRVYLELTFEEAPSGYKSEVADPFFNAGNYRYFVDCGEPTETAWTTRCESLGWNAARKSFAGYFVVTEPDPRRMRTNRTFTIKPYS